MNASEWLRLGQEQGWIVGEARCATHDGVFTDDEIERWHEHGDDPCVFVLRITPEKNQ